MIDALRRVRLISFHYASPHAPLPVCREVLRKVTDRIYFISATFDARSGVMIDCWMRNHAAR